MNEKEKQKLMTEVNILRSLAHPHIVRYYDRVLDKAQRTLYIVMEFCAGGDLVRLLKQQNRLQAPLPEEFIWKVLLQVEPPCFGLEMPHKRCRTTCEIKVLGGSTGH